MTSLGPVSNSLGHVEIAQVLVGHKISRFQPKRNIFSPFYSEKCKYFLGMKIIFGVIGTLSEP